MSDLSRRDVDLLLFEAHTAGMNSQWKADVVRDLFDLSATSYAQLLLAAARHPQAVKLAPAVVRRLRAITSSPGRHSAVIGGRRPQRAKPIARR
ncbi:MAG TPA: DUF3263 domain-containing protein [Mycobacteriales bacterium]|nr:DUF3263 domain-containing protein [Mycobacteriales bacterium]